MANARPRLFVNTSLRWNSIWSHSHELVHALAGQFPILYYEPPRLTTPRSTVLFEKNRFPRPAGVRFLSSTRAFKTFTPGYFFHYRRHTKETFEKHKDDFDVFLTYNVYELANLRRAKRWGKKIVFVYADEYDELTTLPLLKPYLRYSLRQFLKAADLVVCTARALEAKAKRLNANVVYLPNAVNLADARSSKASSGTRRGFTLGFLGAIEPWVDWQLLVDAAKRLANERDVRIDIIGDGTALAPFKAAASGLRNITFHGYVPHKDVYKHIARWDAAIIPFRINTVTNSVSPIKLFEYWLLQKPVLATRTTELKQYNQELLLVSSAEDVVRKIHKLRSDRSLGKRLGSAGRSVVSRCNWQAYAKTYAKLIRAL